jgi:hypothetical protein
VLVKHRDSFTFTKVCLHAPPLSDKCENLMTGQILSNGPHRVGTLPALHLMVKTIPVSGTLCLIETENDGQRPKYVYWIDLHSMYLHYNKEYSCYHYEHEVVCGQKQFGIPLHTHTLPEATVITTKK